MVEFAVLTCVARVGVNGERCIRDAKPGSRRCQKHSKTAPPRRACQHLFEDGVQCERWVKKARVGKDVFCDAHRVACVNPSCTSGVRVGGPDRLCISCEAVIRREVKAAEPPPEPAPKRLCQEMSAETGTPCGSTAMVDQTCCWNHRNLPPDGQRCQHVWAEFDDRRCPKRHTKLGGDTMCNIHRALTGEIGRKVGENGPVLTPCPTCGVPTQGVLGCQEHAPDCVGMTKAGTQCTRRATTNDPQPLCKSHLKALLRDAAVKQEQPLCGISCGEDGHACIQRKQAGLTVCRSHRSIPDLEHRCNHTYGNADQCPAKRLRDTCDYCEVHYSQITCQTCGVPTARADGWCGEHAPRCVMVSAPTGKPCTNAKNPRDIICTAHRNAVEAAATDGRPHCQHEYDNGMICPGIITGNGARWDQLCRWHRIPCTGSGEPHLTGKLDGLCQEHRPSCTECERPNVNGTLCGHHASIAENGECVLLVLDGKRCAEPATVHTADGFICARHHRSMPSDEDRCQHVWKTGQRCALSRNAAWKYCKRDAPKHTTVCEWITISGQLCGDETVPRYGIDVATCENHSTVPVDDHRCTQVLTVAGRSQVCPGQRWEAETTCYRHTPRAICGITTMFGVPCTTEYIVRDGQVPGCSDHANPLPDAQRCLRVFDGGVRCPAARRYRRGYCSHHVTEFQPRCEAVFRSGVRCSMHAPTGETTCDYHPTWVPGTFADEDPDWVIERFFLRPNAEFIAELEDSIKKSSDNSPDSWDTELKNEGDNLVTNTSTNSGRFTLDYDPYDLTGASRLYDDVLEAGGDEDEAREAAIDMGFSLSRGTVRSYTSDGDTFFGWCLDEKLVACPASRPTLARFIAYLSKRGRLRDGEALSAGSMKRMKYAISGVHKARGLPDPFAQHPQLARQFTAHERLHGQPTIEAHGIRLNELESLLLTTQANAIPNIRDIAIVTVVTDQTVGMNFSQAVRMEWEDVTLAGRNQPNTNTSIAISRAKRKGVDFFTVPNLSAAAFAAMAPNGAVPAVVNICGTQALSLLYLTMSSGATAIRAKTPVFCSLKGTAMSAPAIRHIIKLAGEKAGLPYQQTYTQTERMQLVDALSEGPLIAIRDAAIMSAMWWASLRRSEAAALLVRSIQEEPRKRGMIVAVGFQKNGSVGDFTPVGHFYNLDGTRHAADLQTVLNVWLDAYERWSITHRGRSLDPDDPLFPNITNYKGAALTERGIGDVLLKYAESADVLAELGEKIASHGFRRGFAQEMSARGMSAQEIARLQRRKTIQSVLTYTGRPSDPFQQLFSSAAAEFNAEFDIFAALGQNGHKRGR